MTLTMRIAISILVLSISFTARGHHSIGAIYDFENPSELVGTVTAIRWMNPHIRFSIESLNENNELETWNLESGSLNTLERKGVGQDMLAVGDKVSVTGFASRHTRNAMIAGHVTREDGERIVLWSGLFGGLVSDAPSREIQLRNSTAAEAAKSTANSIFRVWSVGETYSRDVTDKGSGDMALPYRTTALAARASYDPLSDDTALRCVQQGMPGIMDNPFPIEILEQNGNIIVRTEQWDVVRTIHMGNEQRTGDESPTPQGYSRGSWQDNGEVLIVTTNNIDWPYFDDIGTPLSTEVETLETFQLSADENRLNYTITVTDPATFTAPFTLDGFWVWVPGEQIKPYNCSL